MNPGRMIPLADLEPDAGETDHAARLFARRDTLDAADRTMATYAAIHAEILVDALEEGNALLAAVALRGLIAHIRAGRARRTQLAAETPTGGAR
ncbi:hypothetical protein BBK14_07885 [Parafrankia soli]|uniref:Uncharacterized protein n=1 Tax=Parafrankia soli TaxID=2599596 RepID=A0A1S1PIW3_9ACTN|nr:hypothetical protein [Parafrankia soli]OHV21191.1 hypothetical protein BBK14_07885 [Parafrankia soli]